MWKILFEQIFKVEPQTGFILIDLFLPMFLGSLMYKPVFSIVGKAYRSGIIHGSLLGKIFHWLLRALFVYLGVFVMNMLILYWKELIVITMIVFCTYLCFLYIKEKRR